MHTPEEQKGCGDDLLEEVTVANVEDFRAVRPLCSVEIVICDADIPVQLSFGHFYIQAPSGHVLEAARAHIPEFLRNLEAGVSEARRAALPSGDFWLTIYGAPVAESSVVPDSGER